jgi:hypothetical protein
VHLPVIGSLAGDRLPNQPLQWMIASVFPSNVNSCRDGAGSARASSRPCYAWSHPSGAHR